MEEPPPKFFRLAPGREVRLRNAYFITCDEVVKDDVGPRRRAALHVRPRARAAATRPTAGGRRRRSTGSRPRTPSRPRSGSTTTCSRGPTRAPTGDLFADLNPASETIVRGAMLEPALAEVRAGRDRPVRAAGLLRAGPGLAAGGARLQPDADAQGHAGRRSRRRAASRHRRIKPSLASGQAVRRLTLDQEIEGSNPSSPASYTTGSGPGTAYTTSGDFVRHEQGVDSNKEPRDAAKFT